MRGFWLVSDIPPVARWLLGIGGVLSIGSSALNGWAELRHVSVPLTAWQVETCGGLAFLLWGIALIMTALRLHRREPRSALYTQSWLWFGLLCLAILPNTAILVFYDLRAVPEGLVGGTIILSSLMASLFCLALGVYFWWQKRRRLAH